MTTQPSDDRLDTLLQQLGPEDPPAGFADSVLSKVARTEIEDTRIHAFSKVIPFSSGGIAMTMTKKAMWGLAAAATIILGVFVARGGFPTVDRGTEGAIGAAKKYQVPQIATSDVVTGDASAQEFLQSETFDRLIKDPEAVSLLSDATLRVSLSNKAFADAMRASSVREFMRNGAIARIYGDAAARSALEDAVRASLSAAAVRQVSAEAAVRGAAAQAALKSIEARADLRPSMKADLKSALEDASMRTALESDAFRSQLADSSVRAMLSRPQISAALNNASFVAALGARGFSAAVRSNRFETAIAAR